MNSCRAGGGRLDFTCNCGCSAERSMTLVAASFSSSRPRSPDLGRRAELLQSRRGCTNEPRRFAADWPQLVGSLAVHVVLAGALDRQDRDARPAGLLRLGVGDRDRQDAAVCPYAQGHGPVRAGLLVRPVAGGALPLAVGAPQPFDGGLVRGVRQRGQQFEAQLSIQ